MPTDTFQQGQTSSVGNFTGYAWSNAANWTNGVPVNGDTVVFNQGTTSNPDGYDDIANLYLDKLTLTQGFISVTGTLEIGAIAFSAQFGEVTASTLSGNASALLTVDSFANANLGNLFAVGAGAVVNVLATTDPGEVYLADDGGEVELTAALSANSTLQFSSSTSAATFALRTASGTIAAALYDADVGKSIALPGSSVSSVTFGAHSIAIVTNIGTTTFSNVSYASGDEPTGYTVSTDPTGLKRITFTAAKSTTFQQGQTSSVGNFTGYAWSNAANWTNGVPVNGDTVVFNQGTTSNPDGYDDIANLYLDKLTLTQGFISVTGTLEIGAIAFSAQFGEVTASTLSGNASALLTVDSFANANLGYLSAVGAGAVVNVLATTDPGEVYLADDGGEVELTAALSANSTLQFSSSTSAATVALRTASGTIAAALYDADVGKSIALPGSSVSSVTFGAHSIAIVTNIGTTTFSNVSYASGDEPTGYAVSTDPTGLKRITFTAAKSTTFQQGQTSSVGNFTGYAWSNAANWTNGVPVNGDTVVFNQGTTSNPDGYDDIANLYLDKLTLTQGFISVTGTLEIGALTFSAQFGEITATTYPGNASALLTVDGFANANLGNLFAVGAGAVVNVLATTDPGEVYLADGGGEVELTALPSANSTLQFSSSTSAATFALRTASGTIAAALYDADVGKSIALPGSSVSSVTFGAHSIAIVTNIGTTTFSNVSYASGDEPTGYTVSTDPTGLKRITFTAPKSTTFQQGQTSSVGNFTGYAWSNAANWTNGVPVNGDTVVFNQGTTSNPDGYDDIANLYLDKLTLTQGFISVTGTLEIGAIAFSAQFGEVTASTLSGNASALLTVDSFANANLGYLSAVGAGAVVNVLATTDPGEVYLADDGGEVELTAALSANSTLQFSSSTSAATVALRTASGTIAAALYDADVGKSIALPGSSVSSVTFGAHSIAIVTNIGTTTFSNVSYASGDEPTGYTVSTDPTGLERVTFACYARGTHIATPRDATPIECLTIGDEVLIASGGTRLIKWLGYRALDLRRHPAPERVWPIRISADAFGAGLPRRDLWLSPGHNIAHEGHLIPASALINGISVEQLKIDFIEYWHIELDSHGILLAENLPAESYLDTGNRTAFSNGGAFVEAHPDFRPRHWTQTCLPLALEGQAVAATKARLLANLAEKGYKVSQDANTHLEVDGIRMRPIRLSETRLAFALPYQCREIWLRSRTFVPARTVAGSNDLRTLGLCVAALQIDGSSVELATDEACAVGWRGAEYENGMFTHRWTTGATQLPAGARVVIVDLAGAGYYWNDIPDKPLARFA